MANQLSAGLDMLSSCFLLHGRDARPLGRHPGIRVGPSSRGWQAYVAGAPGPCVGSNAEAGTGDGEIAGESGLQVPRLPQRLLEVSPLLGGERRRIQVVVERLAAGMLCGVQLQPQSLYESERVRPRLRLCGHDTANASDLGQPLAGA